ncbi:hypothetical protein CSW37_01475 [Thermus scotoductus]|uniref:Ribonucleotide reductase large subunit C-terminal domain-containing protein n=1 Tax=Thermus scotoductus TaxID=37636 RepID=A0A430SHN6_THESC|nr:hypothetical protein [Thermus scotoductus]RTH39741.1 hypothetical protein CSW37_01475 [Thermus scotoductus]
MPRWYAREEALRLALNFFQGDELRASVFLHRYALKDPEGRLLEATPEEMWQRLVQGVTRVEKGATQEFSWLFSDFRFRIKEAAYWESTRLARQRGSFPAFDPKEHIKSPFIQSLPEALIQAVEKGLRNAALLSIAPTGSISILAGVTSGIEPIFALTYLRHAGGQVFLAEHPLLKRYRRERGGEVPDWPTAHTVDPFQRVHLQATLQRHVDQSISSTVNLPRETPKEVVENLFLTAWKEGCKGITVFREGSREEVIEPLPPVGVCTFCRTA